jgi:hypothetical protein
MTYPPEVTIQDCRVLEIIGRGHPERKMTATNSGGSKQIAAITWSEIQVALGATTSKLSDSIAHLVANNLIMSGDQRPSIWGRIKGESNTTFFWITSTGESFLRKMQSNPKLITETEADKIKSTTDKLKNVEMFLSELGYDITTYGGGVALLSLESGYSPWESASHLALSTLALDSKKAGKDIFRSLALLIHARTMVDVLSEVKDAGLMREEIFKSDARAMLKVATPENDQATWIARVLNDPIVSKDRVASSRIDYANLAKSSQG